MAQGPSDTILVAILIRLRIQESKVRIDVFGGGLCSLSISSSIIFARWRQYAPTGGAYMHPYGKCVWRSPSCLSCVHNGGSSV